MRNQRKLAYLMSQYPAVSHTFFLNEVIALRARGFVIETASINAIEPPPDGFSSRELEECAATYYLKAGSKMHILQRLASISLAHPGVLLRGMREAFTLTPWNLPASIYAIFYLMEAMLLGAWMRDNGCDHLHVHFSGPVATVGLLASIAWDIPYSLTVHGPDEFYDLEKFYLHRKIERAAFVTCISHFCRSQLLRIAPHSSWPKFHVCRLGVDETVFHPVPKRLEETARLTCVGRLHSSKGQGILLEAMARLKQQGFRVHLDLIGGGSDRQYLETLIAREQLEEQVTLHGATSHERTRTLLEACDIFVLASFAEGVPVALMEAMAMEIVCVSTFVAGIPELIVSGEEGLLVAPSSVEELCAALAMLLRDPDRRRTLAAAGRKKVLASYNLARNADHLADLFRSCKLG